MVPARAVSFQDRYGNYDPYFMELSTGTCNATLAEYTASPSDALLCDAHVSCILGATYEARKAHIASAAIFLGMVPTLLSLIAPSISQLALLSTRRPLLALLISSGSTVLLLDRLFRVETLRETFTRAAEDRSIPRFKQPWAILTRVGEYLLVVAAAVNVLQNSQELGNKAIIVWKCELNFMPLLWVLCSPFIFLVVAIPFQLSAIAKFLGSPASYPSPLAAPEKAHSKRERNIMGKFMAREITPAIRLPTIKLEEIPNPGFWTAILLNVGFCLAAGQVLFGIGVLSSVLFVSVKDAVWIGLRYLASAIVCRLVVALELACMKLVRRPDN